MFAPGEQERYEAFFVARSARIAYRIGLETALMATDPLPYLTLQDNYEALVRDAQQRLQPPEAEFEDSPVVKNHNIW